MRLPRFPIMAEYATERSLPPAAGPESPPLLVPAQAPHARSP